MIPKLAGNLYSCEQVRLLDREAIEQYHIPGAVLMERAGEAAFHLLRQNWPEAKRIVVLCGLGNNAGDGYVVARLAKHTGLQVEVVQLGESEHLKGDALQMYRAAYQADVEMKVYRQGDLPFADVYVDALFGTGLQRTVESPWADVIRELNVSDVPVLAIDVPSGLNADTGVPLGVAVKATRTITFIGIKKGLMTAYGADYCGQVCFDDLRIPHAVYDAVNPVGVISETAVWQSWLAPRRASAHKGDHGTVLLIGGNLGMSGAIMLAAHAALRCGAGRVVVATRAQHAVAISQYCPEVMAHGVESAQALIPLLQEADVIALGPGMGRDQWAQDLWMQATAEDKVSVLDADALRLLASHPKRGNWVLTPHPGEAGGLLGYAASQIQADRFDAVHSIQQRYGGIVVLKGAGSLIKADAQEIVVCNKGNPGMATAGMGDVLTGVIAALLAQGLSRAQAAIAGVEVHAMAADLAAKKGQRGLIARDAIDALRSLVNPQ